MGGEAREERLPRRAADGGVAVVEEDARATCSTSRRWRAASCATWAQGTPRPEGAVQQDRAARSDGGDGAHDPGDLLTLDRFHRSTAGPVGFGTEMVRRRGRWNLPGGHRKPLAVRRHRPPHPPLLRPEHPPRLVAARPAPVTLVRLAVDAGRAPPASKMTERRLGGKRRQTGPAL